MLQEVKANCNGEAAGDGKLNWTSTERHEHQVQKDLPYTSCFHSVELEGNNKYNIVLHRGTG